MTTIESNNLFEIYKLAVDMADRISARRGNANSFFLTINSALAAIVGVVDIPTRRSAEAPSDLSAALLAVVGLTLALTWWVLLRSYRDLNTAKYAVIMELEKQLPAAIFTEEWRRLKDDPIRPWRKRYAELGFVERVIPLVFAAIYVLLLLKLICS